MDSLSVYRDLADCYDRLGQASMHDRFLDPGGRRRPRSRPRLPRPNAFRQRLLQGSRHHMLRPYASFEEAVLAPDVQTYLPRPEAQLPARSGPATAGQPARRQRPQLPCTRPPRSPQAYPAVSPRPEDAPRPHPAHEMPLMDTSGAARQGNIGGQQWQQQRIHSARPDDVARLLGPASGRNLSGSRGADPGRLPPVPRGSTPGPAGPRGGDAR